MKKTRNYVDYCHRCGAETKPEATGTFDTKTGEPLYRSICSKTPCECGEHHGYRKARGWINFLYAGSAYKCDRCGITYFLGD